MGILRHVIRDVVKPALVDVGDRFWTNPWRSISPIKLKVEYTDTQFTFRFKAPSTSTLNIYDGDGTMTEVAGQDSTLVTHNTSYATPGTYYFYVEGDYKDMTVINVQNQDFVSGDIERLSELTGVTLFNFRGSGIYGDIGALKDASSITSILGNSSNVTGDIAELANIPSLNSITLHETEVHGDISAFADSTWFVSLHIENTNVSGNVESLLGLSLLNNLQFSNTLVTGDISGFYALPLLSFLWFDGCDISFSEANNWSFDAGYGNEIKLNDCNLTSDEVDNVLISFAGGSNSNFTMTIGGNNAIRTSVSDAALATLIGRGWDIDLNE
jgi:hypothetical protein